MALALTTAFALAFLLIPAAQAAAEGTLKVNIVGTGSGELKGEGTFSGTPPIACSYASPGPATGVCEDEMTGGAEFEGFFGSPGGAVALGAAVPAGSKMIGYEVEEGNPFGNLIGCEKNGTPNCLMYNFGGANAKVTATIAKAYKLTVEKLGEGFVESNPEGIACPGEAGCEREFAEGTLVKLSAFPGAGQTFVGWSGCDSGTAIGLKCTVTMSKAKKVKATFTSQVLTVKKAAGSTGEGKVSSSPAGILCEASCSSTTAPFLQGALVKLTASTTTANHSTFSGWSGAGCTTGVCEVTMSAAAEVEAEFTAIAKKTLTLKKAGPGLGTVKTTPTGLNCGTGCTALTSSFYEGAVVTLTATPKTGYSFIEWSGSGSGACAGSSSLTCAVTMSAAKEVTARFK